MGPGRSEVASPKARDDRKDAFVRIFDGLSSPPRRAGNKVSETRVGTHHGVVRTPGGTIRACLSLRGVCRGGGARRSTRLAKCRALQNDDLSHKEILTKFCKISQCEHNCRLPSSTASHHSWNPSGTFSSHPSLS